MPDAFSAISRDYLSPPRCSFWRWTDDAQTAEWQTSKTIAFRPEIDEVIAALASQGLPPFESVLLFLAACRDGWRDNENFFLIRSVTWFYQKVLATSHITWRAVLRTAGLDRSAPNLLDELTGSDEPLWMLMERVLDGLTCLTALPPDERSGPGRKAELAAVLFEPITVRIDEEDTATVSAALKAGFPPQAVAPQVAEHAWREKLWTRRFVDAMVALYQAVCLAPITPDRLRLRRRTGLDELPRPAEVDLPACRQVRRLLAELSGDEELSGLAHVARDLMAVVYLPRRVDEWEDLPVGGISDIANRGDLDRLLPGELAHDDLTLAVRIALKEALYYRREAAHRNPVARRRILIDTGLRMWGVPRVFAAGVALAMAATLDKDVRLQACRTTRGGVADVDLLTREGLVELLAALETQAHPGGALAAFLAAEADDDSPADRVLITHEDVLTDPDFQRDLAQMPSDILYVVSVSREGDYRLQTYSAFGRRALREAKLDLADLFAPPPSTASEMQPLIRKDHDPALPLILSAEPFPLLLPHQIDWDKAAWHTKWGVLTATRDRRLTRWTQRGRAAEQITDALPRGKPQWMHIQPDGTAYALIGPSARDGVRLVCVDLPSGRCTGRQLHPERFPPLGTYLLADRLCLISKGFVEVHSLDAEDRIQRLPLPRGVFWVRGRCFSERGRWYVLARGAEGKVALEPIPPRDLAFAESAGGVLAVFDREGLDGPWVVCANGEVRSIAPDGKRCIPGQPPRRYRLGGISRDGHRVVLIGHEPRTHRPETFVLDLQTGRMQYYGAYPRRVLCVPHPRNVTSAEYTLRRKITKHTAIGLDAVGSLCLERGRRAALCIDLSPDRRMIELTVSRDHRPKRCVARFQHVRRPGDVGYNLRMATGKDGSKLWLDSRGLIHLKSSEENLPEIALVFVAEGGMAGWASNGTWYGPEYFVGDHPTVDARTFYEHIHQFTRRLR